jgi:hypothetical protein
LTGKVGDEDGYILFQGTILLSWNVNQDMNMLFLFPGLPHKNLSKFPSNDYRTGHVLVRYCRLTVDVRIIFNWILRTLGDRVWNGYIDQRSALVNTVMNTFDCIKNRGFLV